MTGNKNTKKFKGRKNVLKKPKEVSKRIVNVEKRISNLQHSQELKWHDTTTGGVNFTTTGALFLLNGLVTGDSAETREGQQITVTSVQFNCHMYPSSTVGQTPTEVRMIIFWDRQANHVAPYPATSVNTLGLLDDSTVAALLHAPYNHATVPNKYQILYDKQFALKAAAYNSTANNVIVDSINLRKKISTKRIVKYNDVNGGTIADITTNSLYLLLIGSVSTANFYGGFRVYFKDD